MTEEQIQKRREKDRERKAKKRAEKKAAALDLQTPPEDVEVAPETAMQTPSNEKQQGQLLSDAAFSYYLGRQSRRK